MTNSIERLPKPPTPSRRDPMALTPRQQEVAALLLQGMVKVMWSNPGDVVLSPFMGIGSEGHEALKARRKFIGIELKEAYWKQACQNIKWAATQGNLLEATA